MYKGKSGFIDNRMVKEVPRKGIDRFKDKKDEYCDVKGHSGKMTGKSSGGSFARKGGSLTPRKA